MAVDPHRRRPGAAPVTARADLPPVAQADLDAVSRQLGRQARGVAEVAHRCPCGEPDVVRTEPRLPDGTPFPTSFYATCPRLTGALSTLESQGVMREMNDRLETDPVLREAYAAAHLDYLERRSQLGDVPEVAGVSAGGMPARVKCLHVLVAPLPGRGTGGQPAGRRGARDARPVVAAPPVWRRADAAGGRQRAMSDAIRPRVAAIDCGTNSLRLLVADVGAEAR